jgi:hypothetical protein
MPDPNLLVLKILEAMGPFLKNPHILEIAFCSENRETWRQKRGEAAQKLTTHDNIWRKLNDTFSVLKLHKLESKQLVWTHDHGQIILIKKDGKGACGILSQNIIEETELQKLQKNCTDILDVTK